MSDELVIQLAIKKEKRSRYRELLANPKKRSQLLAELNHNPSLDEKFTKWFDNLDAVIKSLSVKDDQKVYLLSDSKEIDGEIMTFVKAIEQVQNYGWGTIILVSPELAIYYGETGERAAIIEKLF